VVSGLRDEGTGTMKIVRDNLGYDPRVRLTAQAADISAANLFPEAPTAGDYEAEIYLEVTATGTSGTLVVTIGYTDAVGATSQATAGFDITGTGRQQGRFLLRSSGSANITYAVSGITTPGSLAYNLSVNARRL
jgi:hypothetical protein